MQKTWGLIAAACLALTGCGTGAANPDYNPPYAVLHGAITGSAVATPAEVRVALVWARQNIDGAGELAVAQELGVRANFPVQFQLEVSQLPPEAAMNAAPEDEFPGADFRFAFGSIVVYEDRNGNGALDLIPLDATTTVDRVLGVPSHDFVFYLEGTPPPPFTSTTEGGTQEISLQAGFSILRDDETKLIAVLPASTVIEIELTAAPELARFMCENAGGGASSGVGVGYSCTLQLPGDCPLDPEADLACAADGLSYESKRCAQRGLCTGIDCVYEQVELGPGVTPPGGPAPSAAGAPRAHGPRGSSSHASTPFRHPRLVRPIWASSARCTRVTVQGSTALPRCRTAPTTSGQCGSYRHLVPRHQTTSDDVVRSSNPARSLQIRRERSREVVDALQRIARPIPVHRRFPMLRCSSRDARAGSMFERARHARRRRAD
jgi:hypothetical protein